MSDLSFEEADPKKDQPHTRKSVLVEKQMSCSGLLHEVISNEKIQKLRESLSALLPGHNDVRKFCYFGTANAFNNENILSTALNKHLQKEREND